MNLAQAMTDEMSRVHKCQEDAERVANSLPENPERGSYYWWARIAREYTGAHFLDSGSAYGYQYQKGILPKDGPHMFLEVYDGKPEYFAINTVAWLSVMLDAAHETAIALENVLVWAGEWLLPTKPWHDVTRDLKAILNMLYACIWEHGKVDEVKFTLFWPERDPALPSLATSDTVTVEQALEMWTEDHWHIKRGLPFEYQVGGQLPGYGDKHIRVVPLRSNPKTIFHKRPPNDKPIPMDIAHQWAKMGEVGERIYAEWIVRYYHAKLSYSIDFKDYQRDMSTSEFIDAALKALPVADVKYLHEQDVLWCGGGQYTYNYDNDLSQDIHIDAEFTDGVDTFAIIRTHNGADARSGFSGPVVAMYTDEDYFHMYRVDGYCFNCSEQYDSLHRYGEVLEEKGGPDLPLDLWRGFFDRERERQAGQLTMPFTEEEWIWRIDPGAALSILKYLDEDEENTIPLVLVGDENGVWAAVEDGYETIPDSAIAGVYCPMCGQYTAGFHSMVYGF